MPFFKVLAEQTLDKQKAFQEGLLQIINLISVCYN
jgi:hypothetical protein